MAKRWVLPLPSEGPHQERRMLRCEAVAARIGGAEAELDSAVRTLMRFPTNAVTSFAWKDVIAPEVEPRLLLRSLECLTL